MKITRRKITASQDVEAKSALVRIPFPYSQYYKTASAKEVSDYCGDEIGYTDSPCEEADGYDVSHLAWVLAKPEYQDCLAANGLDIAELIVEGDDYSSLMLAQVIGDRIVPVSMSEVEMCTDGVAACTNIVSSIDTGMEYWYGTKHGLGPGMIPPGVAVLDTIDDGWYTYVLLDKMLTTDELKEYDLKEEMPPQELMACDDITASIDSEFDDIPSFDYSYNIVVPGIEKTLGVDREIAHLIYTWYDLEGIWEDFDSLEDFLHFLQSDIRDMAEACDDEFEKNKVLKAIGASSSCKKASETDDEIRYIVSNDEEDEQVVEGMSLVNYKGYKLQPDRHTSRWDILNQDKDLIKSGFYTEGDARRYVDDELVAASTDIYANEEEEMEEDFLDQPDQEFASAETAINGKQGKLPAVFKKADIPHGALVLDYGGGTVESEAVAQDYLNQFDAVEMLYDPYNQTPEHNREIVKALKKNGGADVAICSNVLNVIKEEEVRLDLLNKIKKLLKPGATAFISVYEGNTKLGEGAVTQKGKSYQNNRKLAGYLEEVQQVFPNATKKGAVIIAPNTAGQAVESSTYIDNSNIDTSALQAEIEEGVLDYMTSPACGFDENEAREYSFVEVNKTEDAVVIEVRAELRYDGLIGLSNELDPIVQNYNSSAYFDVVTDGIIEAYLPNESIEFSQDTEGTPIEGAIDWQAHNRANEAALNAQRDRWLEPDDYAAADDGDYPPVNIEFEFNCLGSMSPNGYETHGGGAFDSLEYPEYIDEETIYDDFWQEIADRIPWDDQMYRLEGVAHLAYYPEKTIEGDVIYHLDTSNTYIDNFSAIPFDDMVEGGTTQVDEDKEEITAAMTDDEVRDAIEQGKPFDIDSFDRYWWRTEAEDEEILRAESIEVGDIIDVQFDASEVDLGTVVKILSVNDPGEDWVDYTFKCEVQEDWKGLHEGDIVTLHFDGDERVGYLNGTE